MKFSSRHFITSSLFALGLPFALTPGAFAAKAIDLNGKNPTILQSFLSNPMTARVDSTNLQEIRRNVDFNHTTHVRLQQTYAGYPILGAEAIVHIPQNAAQINNVNVAIQAAATHKGSLDGIVYQSVNTDLANTPAFVFTPAQAQKALTSMVTEYKQTHSQAIISAEQSKLIVYMDEQSKAHWAFWISFDVAANAKAGLPEKPNFIIDAISLQSYQSWNNLQTESVEGGGFGGNKKMGKLVYDGLGSDLAKLTMQRDATSSTCTLENEDVAVISMHDNQIEHFVCKDKDAQHQEYWNGAEDAVNDGYSPANDALFAGKVIKDMYMNWYNIPVLTKNGKPMLLEMVVHAEMDNAYWDGKRMTFGDGIYMFYPLTSLGVGAHEISHGFTQQHSGLMYFWQSGGINESFSDMAAQAAEFYAYGHNSWQIGPEIFKEEGRALRYMDQPSKDCDGRKPGQSCSIDDAKQYRFGLNVHYSSGVFNRAFYLISTSPGWDTKKAFDIMQHANSNYWTSYSGFSSAACGVVKAARDYKYDVYAVRTAFSKVGIKATFC